MVKTIYQFGVINVITLILGIAGMLRAEQQTESSALIDNAIRAAGGAEKLTKFKAIIFKGEGVLHVMGIDVPVPYVGEVFAQGPRQLKMTADIIVGSQKLTIVKVMSNEKGWQKVPGEDTKEMTEPQIVDEQAQRWEDWVGHLIPLKDKAFTIASIGDLKINDRVCAGIRASHEGKPDVTLFIDKETHLLAKSEIRVKDIMTGQEVHQESFYSDYKEAKGIKYASKMTIKRDGKVTSKWNMTEYKPLEKLEDDVFTKP